MKTKWFILLLTLCSVIIAEGFGNKEEKVTCVVSGEDIEGDYKAVSYTHLTLPTICSV